MTAAESGAPGAHRAGPAHTDPGDDDSVGDDSGAAESAGSLTEVLPGLDTDPNGGPGTTRIADKAVEKIAQQSVDNVDRASGAARHVLGVKVGSLDEDTPARVHATVDGDLVSVAVSMAVRWPESVRQVTRQARKMITEDVTRLTGMRVAEVDITVPELLRIMPQPGGTPMSVFHRVLSVVLALAFLLAGVLTVIEIIGAALGHHGHVVVAYERPSRWLHGQPWTAHWVIAGLIVAAVVGLLLLITGLKPRQPGLLVMRSDVDGVTLAVPRRSLARAVSRVAGDVDGISTARTELGSRQARVRTVTHLRDTAGLTEQVQSAVAGFLDGLGLERTPTVRVSLNQEER